MDVKVSSANEARTVSVSSTAHIPLLSNETKSSAERNSDSGYHSWSSIECQSSKNLTDRSNMQSVASGLDQAEKSCLNGSTPFSDPSYSSACLKDQTMDKVVFSHANAHCNHNVCNYSRESHKRLSDVDNNANVISKINESGNMTMNSHSEHCIVTTCCGCLSFTNSTSSIVQSTSRSSVPFHHPNYQPQTQTLFSHSSQEAMSNVLENSKDNLQSEAQDLAMKIEFCLKFGYTTSQIRSVISKISYKATKNDIIQELFNVSSVENGTLRSSGQMPLTDLQYSYNQDVNHAKTDPKYEKFVGRGISPSSQDIYQSRGPLSLDETKEPPKQVEDDSLNLRPIVIDGSNVAMSHGNKQYFSCKGILLAVDYFRSRNHRDITVFIPAYRKESPRPDAPIQEREILDKLEKERILVYTPSRCINGIRVTCYDDRFILRLAEETDGVVVSNDNFRDLQNEKPQWKELIEKRLLMYSFVNDRFMPPDDPLGRNGPSIDNFLRKRPACEEQIKPQCPYGKKCTYGKKCKFFHPECSFSQKSVTDQLKEKSEKRKKASMEAENLAEEFLKSQPHRDTVSNLGPRKNETPTMLPGSDGIKPKDGEMMNDLSSGSSTSSSGRLPTFHSASSQANHGQRLTGGNVQPYHGHHNSGYQWPVMGHPDPNRQQYAHNSDGGLSDAFKQMAMSNNSPHHVQNMHGNNNPYNTMHRVVDAQMMQQHHQQQQQQPYSNPPFVRQQHQQQAYRYPDSGGPPDLHAKTGRNLQPPNIVQQNSSPGAYQPVYEGSGGMRQMVHPQHYNMPNHHPQFASMPPHAPYVQPHPMFQYNNQHNQSPLHQPMIYSPYANMHPGMVQQQNMHHGMVQPALYMPLSHGSGSISRSMPGEPLSSSSANSDDPKTFPPRRINQKQQQVGFDQGCGAYVNSGSHGVHQHNQHTPNSAEVSLDSQVNPRHNLFKNLCGLFPRVIVEKVMMDNPEMREPKKLIKLCLEEEN